MSKVVSLDEYRKRKAAELELISEKPYTVGYKDGYSERNAKCPFTDEIKKRKYNAGYINGLSDKTGFGKNK